MNVSKTRRLHRSQAGFTLVELSVALVAGLIVGIAVVGLSKEATNTFHEETRAASAETMVRTAIERLRSDLSRAAYMSSPNIMGDPSLVSSFDPTVAVSASFPLEMKRMAGIRLYDTGSIKNTKISSTTTFVIPKGTDDASPALSAVNFPTFGGPDAIDITGNLNSTEVYSIGSTVSGGASGGACTAGDQLIFNQLNPPAYRLGAIPPMSGSSPGAGAVAELARQFQPVASQLFLARIVDPQGRAQYVQVCNTGYTAQNQPYVMIIGSLLQANATTVQGGAKGFGGMTINPVLTARYRIAPTIATYAGELNPTNDAGKYDLYRVYLNASGNEVGTPELVAEYAVDLKFAFTVDNSGVTNTGVACPPPTNYCPPYIGPGSALGSTTRTYKTFAFGDSANATWAADVGSGTGVRYPGPQRIRSVRVRFASRTSISDRTVPLAPPSYEPGDFLYRYCTKAGATLANCKQWARVRTVVTEVALNNQSRALYP